MYKGIESSFVNKFRKAISQEIEDKRFAISQGNIPDMIQYNSMCAQIQGLESSIHIFDELVKKLQDDEEDKG